MGNEIINVVQLPIIEEQLQTIKKDIESRTEKARALMCTPETVKVVKAERASLNKELKEWEARRKEVKESVMLPYMKFEEKYQQYILEVYKKADAELKERIDEVENNMKTEKLFEVTRYFEEYAKSKSIDFVSFEDTNINITLSASQKSLKEQAKAFIDKVEEDLKLISVQEHAEEILIEYKKTFNCSAAITTVVDRHKQIEKIKIAENARKEQLEQMENVEKKVDEVYNEVAPPTVEEAEPPKTVIFKVTAPLSKLKQLKEFLNIGGYIYE